MNDPKRYEAMGPEVIATPTGEFVRWEDYARLRSVAEDNKKECEATRIENARLKAALGKEVLAVIRNTFDEIKGLKAEVERMTIWQPIETAPRDGTAILGCCGWEIEVTAFQKGTERYQRKEAWVVANDDEGYAQDFKPTHWLPLPNRNPPIKKTKSKK